MEVLHGIYDLSQHKICLWLETRKKLSKPAQLTLRGKSGTAQLMLPTHNSLPISSPLITREHNLEIPSEINLQSHNVKCLYVDVVDIKKTRANREASIRPRSIILDKNVRFCIRDTRISFIYS